jgi:hypothetical protein
MRKKQHSRTRLAIAAHACVVESGDDGLTCASCRDDQVTMLVEALAAQLELIEDLLLMRTCTNGELLIRLGEVTLESVNLALAPCVVAQAVGASRAQQFLIEPLAIGERI